MSKSRFILIGACLAGLISVPNCRPDDGPSGFSQGGAGGVTSEGGATPTGGAAPTGGSTSTTPTGGSKGTGGVTSTAGIASTGGTAPTGGVTSPGGSVSTGGAKPTGGVTSTAGIASTGGTTSTAGTKTGGVTSTGGTISTGGVTSGAGGSAGTTSTGGTTGPRVDKDGVPLAKPGDSTSTSRKYLNLGDMRLICNRWGSDAVNCSSTQLKVAVNSDKTVGYEFNRGTCDSKHGHPDYPEIEFGVAPFGANSSDLTSPAFSSTTLLPIQLKSLTSASVTFDNFASTYQKPGYYDTNFEFWISRENPLTSSNPGVFAEIIVFLDWDNVRESSTGWPCENLGTVSNYKLCHLKDGWGSGWRFINFELNGQQKNFSGKADVKAILDWARSKSSGFTDDMWLTRIEVGTEVDDNTQGSTKINNLTFEINGTSKSIELAQ
jgi:hypothetical protein